MKALSLFSGIGGIDLAAEWAGIETVAFCERDPFCQRVLAKHWPNIPIYDDVCTLTKERLDEDGIGTVDLIFGGYPCQPFSIAGQREGANDDRHLWPEVKRILQEVNHRWFIGENVGGHVSMGLDTVLSDLESINHTWETFIIPACAIDAPHRRDRVFIVGHVSDSSGIGHQGIERLRQDNRQIESWRKSALRSASKLFNGVDWKKRAKQSGFLGTNDGIPDRMDRIRACGNAVVPNQIYPILAAIKQIDDMLQAV